MPRPRKFRKVCHFPHTLSFEPAESGIKKEPVYLTVDEYETIRLLDREGLSQEEAGERMNVARTTVQLIYTSARRKIADVLVEGRPLRIEGGDYRLCNGDVSSCAERNCFKQKINQMYEKPKGDNNMRIAVTYEDGKIFQHFGHTQQFKVYDVQDGKIIASEVVDTNGSGHGALAGVLTAAAGIQLFGGVSGDADAAVEALVTGNLVYNPNVKCNHHGEHHHGEGHTCGDHGCGSHSCH